MHASEWCERAAAMLESGLPSDRVRAELGEPPVSAADRGAIAAAWRACEHAGAPLAPMLDSFASAAREWERAAADRLAALTGPRLATRIIMVLPLAGLLGAMACGLDVWSVVFGTALGWGCLAVGVIALAVSWRWTNRMLANAAQAEPAPGCHSQLLAQLLCAGIPSCSAIQVADRYWPIGAESRNAVFRFAERTGMPPARALRADADRQRAVAAAESRQRASALAVQLTLPLGTCVLPAFIAWGVIPVIVSLARSLTLGPLGP
ncbi:MAG: hypothetical protein ACKOXM_05165 [Agromyces sp.]